MAKRMGLALLFLLRNPKGMLEIGMRRFNTFTPTGDAVALQNKYAWHPHAKA